MTTAMTETTMISPSETTITINATSAANRGNIDEFPLVAVGAGVGGAVLVLIVCVAVLLGLRRRRKAQVQSKACEVEIRVLDGAHPELTSARAPNEYQSLSVSTGTATTTNSANSNYTQILLNGGGGGGGGAYDVVPTAQTTQLSYFTLPTAAQQ